MKLIKQAHIALFTIGLFSSLTAQAFVPNAKTSEEALKICSKQCKEPEGGFAAFYKTIDDPVAHDCNKCLEQHGHAKICYHEAGETYLNRCNENARQASGSQGADFQPEFKTPTARHPGYEGQ